MTQPAQQPDDNGELRQEPLRRRPDHDIPLNERPSWLRRSLTLPAVETSPAAAQSFGIAHGTILALDLGTMTGWALQSVGGGITSGTVSFRPSRYDGGGIRYLRFRAWIDSVAHDAGWHRCRALRRSSLSRWH